MKIASRTLAGLLASALPLLTSCISFDSSTVTSNDVADLKLVNRLYVPYGPDLTTDPVQEAGGTVWEGYGFGFGPEHVAYDPIEGYLYAQSEAGAYITVIDYYNFPPAVTSYSLDLSQYDSDLKDIAVCPEKGLLFISVQDAGRVHMYRTISRDNPGTPVLLQEIDAGHLPDVLLPNSDCSVLAVTNENEGDALNQGAIHLVSNFEQNGKATVKSVKFDGFTDDYLLSRNVHMPLTYNAMIYWDLHSNIADDVDWTEVLADYNPGLFLEPEFMAFTEDGSQLLVNLQENSALLRIDVVSGEAKSVDGYGLKAWTSSADNDGVDIVKDDGCSKFVHNAALYSVRAPDGMAQVSIDGEIFVLTADEGDDKDYGEYEEKREAGELFVGTVITERNMVGATDFHDTTNSALGHTKHFNAECEDNGIAWCADGAEISLGSSAVDYSTDTKNPVMDKIVLFGGRGMSIYKVPDDFDSPMEFVWDSGSSFEIEGCAAYPWAHNGIQDEDFAPLDGAFYELSDPDDQEGLVEMNDPNQDGCEDAGNGSPGACPMSSTIDEKSPEDGLAPESVIVGVACDRLVAVACGENNGNCFIYDISDIYKPVLKTVINLSPASENKAPGVAYNDRTLGELDAETTKFIDAADSPTGKAGVIFAGAISGTLSFYEFECTEPVEPVTRPAKPTFSLSDIAETMDASKNGSITAKTSDGGGLSGGAIAGIVIGCLVGIGIVGYLIKSNTSQNVVVIDSGKVKDSDAL